jgi:hypothetical protein
MRWASSARGCLEGRGSARPGRAQARGRLLPAAVEIGTRSDVASFATMLGFPSSWLPSINAMNGSDLPLPERAVATLVPSTTELACQSDWQTLLQDEDSFVLLGGTALYRTSLLPKEWMAYRRPTSRRSGSRPLGVIRRADATRCASGANYQSLGLGTVASYCASCVTALDFRRCSCPSWDLL